MPLLVSGLVSDFIVCVSIHMVYGVEDCFAALDAAALFDEVPIVRVLLRQVFDDCLDERRNAGRVFGVDGDPSQVGCAIC